MKNSFQLIINPGRYPRYARQLKKLMYFVKRGTIHESRSAGHFQDLIGDFVRSDDTYLLVWGGDGTANLALNCLMKESNKGRRKKMAIGFLRGGSGNGIQDSYEVPHGLSGQVKTYINSMDKKLTQRVDLLQADYDGKTQFGQLFGTGIDARILESRNRIKRRGADRAPRPGIIPYLAPAVSIAWQEAHLKHPSQILSMREGRFAFRGTRTNAEFPFREYKLETTAPLIEVGVRPYYGWYYKICPDVVCNDGFMDAYIFNIVSRTLVLTNLYNFWSGSYDRINNRNARRHLPLIEHYKISELSLSAAENRLFHIDGELHQTSGVLRLSVKKRALKLLVPESFHEKFHPIHEWDEKIK